MAAAPRAPKDDRADTPGPLAAEVDADLDARVRLALATWPQIDPDVEELVTRIAKAAGYLDHAAQAPSAASD